MRVARKRKGEQPPIAELRAFSHESVALFVHRWGLTLLRAAQTSQELLILHFGVQRAEHGFVRLAVLALLGSGGFAG